MFFHPTITDWHSPGRSGPHFRLTLEDVSVHIDAPIDQSEREEEIRQAIWDQRDTIQQECCSALGFLTSAIKFIDETQDDLDLRIYGMWLAGEQEIVLALLPRVAPCDPGNYYRLVNKGSGKVFGVAAGRLDSGAPVVQWRSDGSKNQMWSCLAAREGYFTISPAHSGKLLNVAEASQADGARVIQWPRSNTNNERWQFQEAADDYYNIIARHSGKVLGVAAGRLDDGAPVVQWRNDGTDNQAWRLDRVDQCVPGSHYTIINKGSGKVLGVAGGSLDNWARVVQWRSDGTKNQIWSCVNLDNGHFTIAAYHSGKLLNVAEASLMDGGRVIQWQRANADNERWQFQEVGDGYYNIVVKHSRKVLGVAAGRLEDGAPVVQWRRDGTDNQAWRLEKKTISPVQ